VNALVIGASGLVGNALLAVLEEAGIRPRGTYARRPFVGGIPLDVTDAAAVRACVDEVEPDVIFIATNTSGGVDRCELEPEAARTLHVEGTEHVIAAAATRGARIVYYSTDYIFDGRSGPYGEDDAPHPVSVYGAVKLEAERSVLAQAPNALVIRTTCVYGWDRRSPNFAMGVWERLQAGSGMRVPNDQWTSPTLVEYLAEASVRLLQIEANGVYNVVGLDRIPRSELARQLARAMALDADLVQPCSTADLGQKAERPLQGGLLTEKLRAALGTEPLNLTESLKRFRRHWRADTHTLARPVPSSSEAARLKLEILERVREYHDLVNQPATFVPYRDRVNYAGRVYGSDEMVNLVDASLDFWLTLGPYGEEFEQKMRRFLGARDFALVNSGSSANLTAVLTLMSPQLERSLRPGDEVITPAVTFPTTLAPIVHSGLVPVFVDCEIGTYNVDPNLVENALSPKTRAIMVPHTLGNPCDMDALCDIANRHGLYLVEDSCDALGGTFDGKLVGTFGDLATFSFYPAHHITLGEGGGVAANSPQFSRIVRSVRDWGRDCWCAPGESNTCGRRFGWCLGDLPAGYDHKYTYSNLGYNFKPTDMQAAVGVAQLDRLPAFVNARRRNFQTLYAALLPYQDRVVLPVWDKRADPSWFGFPITVNGGLRQELVQWLENANIETRPVFGGNILRQPAFAQVPSRTYGTLERSDRVMRDTFFIGVYPGLTDPMLAFMVERLTEFLGRG
jgi:CDP-4-dehydro-6-deoxyglucose reductase, E1